MQTLHSLLTGRVVALDGKNAWHAHDRSQGRLALHTVRIYTCESRPVLEQTVVAAPSNEFTVLSEVLALVDRRLYL